LAPKEVFLLPLEVLGLPISPAMTLFLLKTTSTSSVVPIKFEEELVDAFPTIPQLFVRVLPTPNQALVALFQ